MKFSEMHYERPDIEKIGAQINDLVERLTSAATFEEAEAVFIEYERESGHIETMFSLASIRHDVDTNDEFYDAESKFIDENMPRVTEFAQKWILALLSSPFRPEFEAKYGSVAFKNAEMELKTFSPEIIPDLQRENALCSEYSDLIASAQIPFEDGVYTLSQLTPFKQDADDARRRGAWEADGSFYVENAEKLDSIYDELTHLRDGMAKKLGMDNYKQLGYLRMTRNSYTESDVDKYRAAVVEHIVPVACEIYRKQAERLGVEYPLTFADAALAYRSGNARPVGTADDILAAGKKFYSELSPETKEFFDFMLDGELMDVLSRKGKRGGGYCTSLPDYRAPFIFANFNGTSGDVEVVTHEAGHAFAGYQARDLLPSACRWPTLDACEIHSMSMEFFAWPWAEDFFGDAAQKFRFKHLADAVVFIPYGTMVDHFQHLVYEKPDMTPAERHAEWKRLLGIYMPWMKLGEIPFYGDGKHWQRQQHIYTSPFYYIDYCLAQTVALQFWALMQRDHKEAWAAYMRLVSLAGTRTFTELVDAAGLKTPFGSDALREIADAAKQWLDSFDASALK